MVQKLFRYCLSFSLDGRAGVWNIPRRANSRRTPVPVFEGPRDVVGIALELVGSVCLSWKVVFWLVSNTECIMPPGALLRRSPGKCKIGTLISCLQSGQQYRSKGTLPQKWREGKDQQIITIPSAATNTGAQKNTIYPSHQSYKLLSVCLQYIANEK